jgi:hypothetical protein
MFQRQKTMFSVWSVTMLHAEEVSGESQSVSWLVSEKLSWWKELVRLS